MYWLQFGRYFARGPIVSLYEDHGLQYLKFMNFAHYHYSLIALWLQERDDYALELAMADE